MYIFRSKYRTNHYAIRLDSKTFTLATAWWKISSRIAWHLSVLNFSSLLVSVNFPLVSPKFAWKKLLQSKKAACYVASVTRNLMFYIVIVNKCANRILHSFHLFIQSFIQCKLIARVCMASGSYERCNHCTMFLAFF